MSSRKAPLSSERYLYIARAIDGSPTLKVGKSRQLLRNRERALRGQSEVDFEMLRTVATLDETLAERLAFEELDNNGWRKFPNTKREQFHNCTVDQVEAILKRVCAIADKAYALSGAVDVAASLAPAPDVLVSGSNPLSRKLLGMLVPHQGAKITLGHYLSEALKDSRKFKRLEAWGLKYRATTLKTLDVQAFWQHPSDLMRIEPDLHFS